MSIGIYHITPKKNKFN